MKKQKKNNITKQKLLIIVVSVLICFVLGLGIGALINHFNNKKLNVAFFNIEQELSLPIKQKIQEKYLSLNPKAKINFVELTENNFNSKKINKKYDLFISWNGKVTKELENYSKDIPLLAQEKLIKTVNAKKSLPLLLNHWEINYHKNTRIINKLNAPTDYYLYKTYLEQIKQSVFIPFFFAGSDDDTLLAYLSVCIEAIYGNQIYTHIINTINSNQSFTQLMNNDEVASKVIKTILGDSSLDIQNKIIPENILIANQKDIQTFTEDNQIGVLFTSLLNHRKIDLRLMDRYESGRMPVLWTEAEHSLIAPSITIMHFGKKDTDQVLINLVQDDVQSFLSDSTKLAPTNAQTACFDLQADDVRYLAAIASQGPVPDIANACFQLDLKKKKDFANKIRDYLKETF